MPPEASPPPASCAAQDNSHAPRVRRFVEDLSGELQASTLRLTAAFLAALSGAWLLAVTDSWLLRVTAMISILFALLWARTVTRARQSDTKSAGYLDLGEHHLGLVHAGSTRSLPLQSVHSVEIDEDRLHIVLGLDGGERLTIEHSYQGIAFRDLAVLLHEAAIAARQTTNGCEQRNHGYTSER